MNVVLQDSIDPVSVRLLDEHPMIPRVEREEHADPFPVVRELPPTDAWTPTSDYYLG